MKIGAFDGFDLPGNFLLQKIIISPAELVDPLGRPDLAKSVIQGKNITITLVAQSEEEQSVSIYHEMLETLTVAFDEPPESVILMNEADFEQAAREAHQKFGSSANSVHRRRTGNALSRLRRDYKRSFKPLIGEMDAWTMATTDARCAGLGY